MSSRATAVATPAEADDEAPASWRYGRWLGAAVAIVVLALLGRHLGAVDWAAVWQALRGTPTATVLAACAIALAGHAAYGLHDVLSSRAVPHGIPLRRVWPSGVCCYGLAVNLGGLLGAAVLKTALYRRQGASMVQSVRVVALAALGGWSGWVLLLAWVMNRGRLPAGLSRSGALPDWLPALSWLLLAGVALYLVACARGVVLRFRRRRLALPPVHVAAAQMVVGAGVWATMAAVLYVCLGGVATYAETLGVLLVAVLAGAIAYVPGSWGVLEFVVVAALAHRAPVPALLASALLFRLAHYLLPLAIALPAYLCLLPPGGESADAPQAAR